MKIKLTERQLRKVILNETVATSWPKPTIHDDELTKECIECEDYMDEYERTLQSHLWTYKGKPFSGISYKWPKDSGQVRWKYKNGKLITYREYHPNNTVAKEQHYKDEGYGLEETGGLQCWNEEGREFNCMNDKEFFDSPAIKEKEQKEDEARVESVAKSLEDSRNDPARQAAMDDYIKMVDSEKEATSYRESFPEDLKFTTSNGNIVISGTVDGEKRSNTYKIKHWKGEPIPVNNISHTPGHLKISGDLGNFVKRKLVEAGTDEAQWAASGVKITYKGSKMNFDIDYHFNERVGNGILGSLEGDNVWTMGAKPGRVALFFRKV